MKDIYQTREQDWRIGKIVYQVFVDRFAPSESIQKKHSLYASPKVLQPWPNLPKGKPREKGQIVHGHELDFWGGDLPSLIAKLPYLITTIGVNTLYLNPIFSGLTNHKYDTIDYFKIAEEFGTLNDLKHLIEVCHNHHVSLILDGVFNHVSFHHPWFQEAFKNPQSPYRKWFVFGEGYPHGYRCWHNSPSLPELNLDDAEVRKFLFEKVVGFYLDLGIDGWRLDTAIELGYTYLKELTDTAHRYKKDTLVIGEIMQYPAGWIPSVDAIIQFGIRDWILHSIQQKISPLLANQQLHQLTKDLGIEPMLKSWLVLENHDVPRLRNLLKNEEDYRLAKILQFTLPGNVQLYQGEELGLNGGSDPENREPFPWDQLKNPPKTFADHQAWLSFRKAHRALAIGDFTTLISHHFIAFARTTNRLIDTRIIFLNPSDETREEIIMLPFGKIPLNLAYEDGLTKTIFATSQGIYLTVKLAGKQAVVLRPIHEPKKGYTPTKYYE